MKRSNFLFISAFLFLIAVPQLMAQVGIGTTTPDASSLLELRSTNKGFLPPRMNEAERDAINNPAEGLTIFNTTSGSLEFYNGTLWISLSGVVYCNPSSQPIAGIQEENIQANRTESGAINNGLVVADQGTAMNNPAHFIVMDLGQVYRENSVIRFDVWGNSTQTRTVITSEVPAGTYVPAGGTNPQTSDVSLDYVLDFYEYTLKSPTRYIQVDMTVRNGGRTEWVEVTITTSCL